MHLLLLTALIFSCTDATQGSVDADGDGVAADYDCDDNDPTVNPFAPEICDGLDNDCDGNIDENVGSTFYVDADGDGFGWQFSPVYACEASPGVVPNATDCDDTHASAHPGAEEICDGLDNDCDGQVDEGVQSRWYPDDDGDGFGAPGEGVLACEAPAGFVDSDSDCDDARSTVSPSAIEVCNGVDDDCDGDIDEGVTALLYVDADEDGYGDPFSPTQGCEGTPGLSIRPTDCDDDDGAIRPGATEICNGVDDDCDGDIDEGVSATWWVDDDGDGLGDPARPVQACGAAAGLVDNADDCDDGDSEGPVIGDVWPDADLDGYGQGSPSTGCPSPGWSAQDGDCDDDDDQVYPGAPETAGDGVDSDCDGLDDPQPDPEPEPDPEP